MENCMQVKISDVDKRDFFLNVFKELYDSKMFVFNDTETLVWFPSEVMLKSRCYEHECFMACFHKVINR